MKIALTRKIAVIALAGLFTQFSQADNHNPTAFGEIAAIVASLNHFPSDADKARLAAIAADENYAQPIRAMATTVANINHSATAEGKTAMAAIQAGNAPERGKALAGIIANLNHTASDADKATIAGWLQ
jgi:hypothetical protein